MEEVLGHKKKGGKLWFLVGLVGEGWVNADYFFQKVDGGCKKYRETSTEYHHTKISHNHRAQTRRGAPGSFNHGGAKCPLWHQQ